MRIGMSSIFLTCVLLFACSDDDGGQNNANENQNKQGVCGDGILDTGEECDDGAANSDTTPDACRTSCRLAFCGDWVLDASELCDNGPQNGRSPNPCKADCTPNVCGDGYVGGDEVCDDGNIVDDSQCRGDCGQDMTLCGDGNVDPGEGCDDAGGNSDTIPDACRTDCQPARCGDTVEDSGENCDDGNTIDDLTCSADCENFCGDDVFNPSLGEECDRGPDNGVSPSDCLDDCTLTTCGDGHVGGTEKCDDGDNDDGDGCSSTCQVEPRFTCTGSPSICTCDGPFHGAACDKCIVFVDRETTAQQPNGWSWATAFPSLQEGIDLAHASSPGCEVWVAAGTYPIYQISPFDTVRLSSSVAIYGGFEGDETARSQRDWETNETVLDGRYDPLDSGVYHVVSALEVQDATLDGFTITGGDAIGPGEYGSGGGMIVARSSLTVANCFFSENNASDSGGGNGYGGGMYATESSQTVSHCTFSDNSAKYGGGVNNRSSSSTVSHCTFTGNSAAGTFGRGGGMYNHSSSPTVSHCTFAGNMADEAYGGGGGMFNSDSSPSVINCTFANNTVNSEGGGMYNDLSSSPSVSGCTFAGNSTHYGGGMYNNYSSPTVTSCTFSGNSAHEGGGMYNNYQSSPTVTSCTFSGNSAENGGGMYNRNSSSPTVRNSAFSGNRVEFGGGMYNDNSSPTVSGCTLAANLAESWGGGMCNYYSSSPTVLNSILWGNTAPSGASIYNDSSTPEVVYSDIAGGYTGEGNKDLDPSFVIAPSNTGPWDAVTWDATTLQTVLYDSGASWTADALKGLFVQPDDADPRWFLIVSNTADTIRVWGDLTDFVSDTDTYLLHDLHLGSSSPCIDAGYGCSTPGGCDIPPLVPETPTTDIEGNARHNAGMSSTNDGTGIPDYVDLGAYEYVP